MVRIPTDEPEIKAELVSVGDLTFSPEQRVAKMRVMSRDEIAEAFPGAETKVGLSQEAIDNMRMFPEPDHAPEIDMRAYYEGVRDDWRWAYAGLEESHVEQPRLVTTPGDHDTENPSHQHWAVERFGAPRCCGD